MQRMVHAMNGINTDMLHTGAQKAADIHRGCPTVVEAADSCIHRERYVHHHRDHTAAAFHQCQTYHQADLSQHSKLGNLKHHNTTLLRNT